MSESAAVIEFKSAFGRNPQVVAIAPGRINLIGEHTDYNEGFVFPAAIDKRVYVAATQCDCDQSEIISLETGRGQPFDARTVQPGQVKEWAAYAAGMAWALREDGHGAMPNVQAVVSGDVPIGSGVSSSAAIEMAFGVLWRLLANLQIENKQMALIAQKDENQFVGVNSGIMDQMASAMGKAGHAMFLDTRSLDIRYARVPDGISVVICDTGKPRALTNSAYNERRSQCEEASRILGVKALRDATIELLEGHKSVLSPVVFKRAKHVITENARCLDFADALEDGDLTAIGKLMRQSHESLRDDYEVSCPDLDQMVEACWSTPGCIGARMTGAGFGGACVALVDSNSLETFRETVQASYENKSGSKGRIAACQLADGASANRL